MKIQFKNVGQGDTIIFEWQSGGQRFVGIIDCKKCNRKNPAVDYLSDLLVSEEKFEIAFIFLSHPHFDHFSGMLDLLHFCRDNELTIRMYGHSLYSHRTYLDWANIDDTHTKILSEIVEFVIESKEAGLIRKIANLTEDWGVRLNEQFQLFCVGPSDDENRAFTEKADLFSSQDNEAAASKAANLLSTILVLVCNRDCVIFSSDATLEAQRRFFSKSEIIADKRLMLAQIPHHGSKDNHDIQFWKRWFLSEDCYVVVSAGKHEKYKHPHLNVLEEFHTNAFKVYSTNKVNGASSFVEKYFSSVSNALDMTSELVEDYRFQDDQVFEIVNGSAHYRGGYK